MWENWPPKNSRRDCLAEEIAIHKFWKRLVSKWEFSKRQLELLLGNVYTANIYSQFTAIGCVTFPIVFWLGLSQPLAVHMTVTDFEEYSLRLSAMFGCNMCSQITVGNVTLPKAVLSTVKIFAVQAASRCYKRNPSTADSVTLRSFQSKKASTSLHTDDITHIWEKMSNVSICSFWFKGMPLKQ